MKIIVDTYVNYIINLTKGDTMKNNIDKYKSMLDIYNQYINKIRELNKELSIIMEEKKWKKI